MSDDKDFKLSAFWKELYIELLASPTDSRSDKAFCDDVGLSGHTLSAWKRNCRKEIYDEVQKRRKDHINELRAKAYKQLSKKMETSVDAIKLAFQLTGDLVERTESKVEYMGHDDKVRRINALLENIGKKKGAWANASKEQEVKSSTGDGEGSAKDLSSADIGSSEPNPGTDLPSTRKV